MINNKHSRTLLKIALIAFISVIMLTSCSKGVFTYESKTMLSECTKIEFKTEKEAIRVQKRIEKNCTKPIRYEKTLSLDKTQLQCSRRIFFKERGCIREKYREQINANF